MTKINHIVFDIGKVLIHWDPEIPYKHLIPDETERAWFLSEVCSPAWNVEQDRGRAWREAEEELITQFPDQKVRIRAFRKHWNEMVPYAIEGSVEILQRFIDQGADVTMLTNFASDTFAEAQERFPFLKLGRGATVSGDVGVIKPDPEIYRIHEESFDLDPQACLFIDDSPKNIEAAKERGWQGIVFQTPEQLERELGHQTELH